MKTSLKHEEKISPYKAAAVMDETIIETQ